MLVICLLFSSLIRGQERSGLVSRTLFIQADTIRLDSVPILPSSLAIQGYTQNDYHFVDSLNALIWRATYPKEPVVISYRRLTYDFSRVYSNKDKQLMLREVEGIKNPFKYEALPKPSSSFQFNELQKQGSISRGISVGNNQNLGVNSNLNLQLSGQITDGVGIAAAISDNNVPIQPEGNTQQLQEFDQVYIQVFKANTKLVAGDFQLEQPESFFLKYKKRLRGGLFETRIPLKSDTAKYLRVQASASVSRGKFARNIIQGIEGNQGPYRLTGSENERFIIALGGTERVYIDGVLLKRGQENDYTIDYNRAEVVFTAKQLITKDKRIVIEFQYTSQTYARSLIQSELNYASDRLVLNFSAYSEQDGKNQPLQQDLSDEAKNRLSEVGDRLDKAFSSGVQDVGFDNGRVRYALQIDSSAGQIDSIFYYSTNPDSARYEVSFSFVGSGQGNYREVASSANGQVYEYVQPVSGVPQGSYEPIILLISPKRRQMFTLNGAYKVSKRTSVQFETAISNFDANTFSSLDGNDNVGNAFKVGVKTSRWLNQSRKAWRFEGEVNHEQVSDNFSEIERFRSVEFDRDWNIRDLSIQGNQYLPEVFGTLTHPEIGTIRAGSKWYQTTGNYSAVRHQFTTNLNTDSYQANVDASFVNASGEVVATNFYRHKSQLKKKFKSWSIGYKDDFENNLRKDSLGELSQAAYRFWEWEVFATNNDSAANNYRVWYNQRYDFGVSRKELSQSTRGESTGLEFGLLKNRKSQLKGKVTYRSLQVLNDSIYQLEPENSVLGRLEYTARMLKNGVITTTFFEVGSGLEESREFVYVEVNPGQGVYTWIDYNDNDIQELNEFEVAPFPDQANFIRVFTQSNNFTRVFTNQFSQSLNITPKAFISEESSLAFLHKFSNQTTYRIDRKTNREEDVNRFNPFVSDLADSNIIALNTAIRNSLFFNRVNPIYGVEYTFLDNRSKRLLTNGNESRGTLSNAVDLRVNPAQYIQLNIKAERSTKSNRSEFFESRSYEIESASIQPKLTYQPNSDWNISGAYKYRERNNSYLEADDQLFDQRISVAARVTRVSKGSIQLDVALIDLEYEGSRGGAVSFEMLEGLQEGRNATWAFIIQRNIGEFLQLNLTYNGRQGEVGSAIHAGGASIRAYF